MPERQERQELDFSKERVLDLGGTDKYFTCNGENNGESQEILPAGTDRICGGYRPLAGQNDLPPEQQKVSEVTGRVGEVIEQTPTIKTCMHTLVELLKAKGTKVLLDKAKGVLVVTSYNGRVSEFSATAVKRNMGDPKLRQHLPKKVSKVIARYKIPRYDPKTHLATGSSQSRVGMGRKGHGHGRPKNPN